MSMQPRTVRRLRSVVIAVVVSAGVGVTGLWSVGWHAVPADESGIPPRTEAELEARFAHVLVGAVRRDGVDYVRMGARRAELSRLVGAIARFGPRTRPAAFRARAGRLAYAINAYNAFVLHAVVERPRIASVLDVHGIVEPATGFGFFVAQRFTLDGATTSLHALENDVLRAQFSDARVHAAINCASTSCPTLAARPYTEANLEDELDTAARGLASEPRHVRVDESRREIVLSAIYTWYGDDFVRDARRMHLGADRLDWVAHYATAEIRDALATARAAHYAVREAPYDWQLNGATVP